jgi:hypothetical protein
MVVEIQSLALKQVLFKFTSVGVFVGKNNSAITLKRSASILIYKAVSSVFQHFPELNGCFILANHFDLSWLEK